MTEPIRMPRGDADAIIGAALTAAVPSVLDPERLQSIVVPAGATLEIPDLSAWRATPTRKTGIYLPATVDAFASYVEQHLNPDSSTVWVHPTSGRVVAILDDNAVRATDSLPGWRQHKAVLELETTPEWNHWASQDGTMMSQDDFAEHVEVGLDDIAEPDAADVLEMAQTFHAKSQSTFRQALRLASGETQLQYDEEIAASAGKTGTLEIPSVLKLALSPFVGEERYAVVARLRYRLNSGRLTLGYKLDRPQLVQRDALEKIAEKLQERFPLTYVGSEPGSIN